MSTTTRRLHPVQMEAFCPSFRKLVLGLMLVAAGLCSTGSARAAAYYWDANGTDVGNTLGGTGNWDISSSLWRAGSATGALQVWPNTTTDSDAYLTGTAGTLTLTTGISVNDVTASATYEIKSSSTQLLTLNGSATPVLDVGIGSTLTISAGLAGTLGFTKSGSGTLVISSTSNSLSGGISVTAGTLRTSGTTASSSLRANDIAIASSSSFEHTGAASEIKLGALSGAGSFNISSSNTASMLVLNNQSFAGTMTAGGLTVRGAATQTFTGTVTSLTGALTLGGRGTLSLAGSATATGITSIALNDRGTLTLDNSGTASSNRLSSGAIASDGGFLAYSGNASGSTETVGSVTFNSGQTAISVQHAAGSSAATVLTLGGITRGTSGSAVNFSSTGGALISSGNGPRIAVTNTVTLSNGVIGASSTTPGYAIVNGSDFATYGGSGATGGIVAATSTAVSGNLSSAGTSNVSLNGNGTATGALSFNTVKIAPTSAGQSLSLGSNTLTTYGVLLDGANSHDFTISGGSIGGNSARYFHVWDSARTLTVSSNLAGASQPIIKAGDGFMVLSGSADQVNISTLGNIYLAGGTLRASPGLNFGTNNILYFRGGVFEIANGATFTRSLVGSTGGVSFENSGGFSAFGSDAIVNLGGSSATVTWGSFGTTFVDDGDAFIFGSTKSNAKLTFQNPINLSGTSYQAREFRVFDNSSSTADQATLSGAISGPLLTDLLKTGEGTLELSGTNTFTGNVIVRQGTLATSGGSALPDGGTIIMADVVGATLQLKANETIGGLSGGGAVGGNVNLQTNTMTVGDQRDSSFGGVLSGTGGKLVKQGTGVLTLSQANTFTGGTTINAGTIRLGSDHALPTTATPGSDYGVALAGGTLMLNGYGIGTLNNGEVTASAGTLTLTQNSTLNFNSNDTTQLVAFGAFSPGVYTLTITGWSGSVVSGSTTGGLLFPSAGWDSSKLASIVFTDLGGSSIPAGAEVFSGDSDYLSIQPIPEPSPKWGAVALFSFIVLRTLWQRR